MNDRRSIAYDATFMILYIGFTAGMTVLSLALVALLALDVEFGALQVGAAALNLLGWAMLPFAPRLYRRLVGQQFSWRVNRALGGEVES